MRVRHCVQQRFLNILAHFVVGPYMLSMLLEYHAVESCVAIDDDVLSSRLVLHYYSLLSIASWLRRFLGATH
jgi:hypothetical protein